MNIAKIQYSSGHNEEGGAGEGGIYQNINRDPENDERTGGNWAIATGELALVKDAGWIFTKNAIIGKAVSLFSGLAGDMTAEWERVRWPSSMTPWLPALSSTGPKISKGENYQGLPWVVLDHPRLFTKEDVFAIRTLFWWGHYFSVTLHLKGVYKERWLPVIRRNIPLLSATGFHICISEDEWRHELATDNYLSLREAGAREIEDIFEKATFLKFSAIVMLGEWNEAPTLLMRLFQTLLQALTTAH
jgi:hypothetical protein